MEQLGVTDFKRRVVANSFPDFLRLPDALKEMHFVQADPIRSPARAQDLILRHRVAEYVAGDLEKNFPDLEVEEGYLFAYGFMTPEVWRHLRWRPHRRLGKLERAVLDTVAELGEVHPRGLVEKFGRKSVKNYWGGNSQETKRILEKLHHYGYLRVCRREKGIRVYRVLEDFSKESAGSFERYHALALTTALVFGPTTRRFLVSELRSQNHLLPARQDRLAAVESLVKAGELVEVEVAGVTYLWRRNNYLSDEVTSQVRILAPFDPLVRNRDRFMQLWGWPYRFEAYVPEANRERGYYAMPVLCGDEVIGWTNAKVEFGLLKLKLGFATKRPRSKAFRLQLESEAESMTSFLGLESGAWELTL